MWQLLQLLADELTLTESHTVVCGRKTLSRKRSSPLFICNQEVNGRSSFIIEVEASCLNPRALENASLEKKADIGNNPYTVKVINKFRNFYTQAFHA